jgi:thiol-disulfide isomerase/thioredoxin
MRSFISQVDLVGLRPSVPRTLLLRLVAVAATLAPIPPTIAQDKAGERVIATLAIGDAAPDFHLPGIDGRTHALADYRSAPVLMVAFISNHCPDSNATAPRLVAFAKEMAARGVMVVAINPNHPEGLSVDELGYSRYDDSFADMKRYAAEVQLPFPYLWDGETQATAAAYGCLTTPHVFIFDAGRRLRYKGQFDNSPYPQPETIKTQDARAAVEALLAGKPVPVAETKPHGCSTKWRAKKESVAKRVARWDAEPVVLETADLAKIKALTTNDAGRFRLINVWATWCGPCVEEFPILVQAMRRFSMRPFDLITISVDHPGQAARVQEFLEGINAGVPKRTHPALKQEGRQTNHYLYAETDWQSLMQVLDPKWPGGVPHTILVAPDGKVLWRHTGELEEKELIDRIVDTLGSYFPLGERG